MAHIIKSGAAILSKSRILLTVNVGADIPPGLAVDPEQYDAIEKYFSAIQPILQAAAGAALEHYLAEAGVELVPGTSNHQA